MEKADLSKGYWNLKGKLGVTMHFSEMTEVQFAKKVPYIALYWQLFKIIDIASCSVDVANMASEHHR